MNKPLFGALGLLNLRLASFCVRLAAMNATLAGHARPLANHKAYSGLRSLVRGDFVVTAGLLPLLLAIGCRA